MNKIIYKATSSYYFLGSLIARAGCIMGIAYLLFHYNENPVVIIIAVIICFFAFIIIGNDEITVYADKIVQKDTSIIGFLLKSKGTEHYIKDIQTASLKKGDGESPGIFGVGVIMALVAFLPKQPVRDNQREIFLDLKNGETVTILTDLGYSKIDKIVQAINSLL